MAKKKKPIPFTPDILKSGILADISGITPYGFTIEDALNRKIEDMKTQAPPMQAKNLADNIARYSGVIEKLEHFHGIPRTTDLAVLNNSKTLMGIIENHHKIEGDKSIERSFKSKRGGPVKFSRLLGMGEDIRALIFSGNSLLPPDITTPDNQVVNL